MAECVLKVAYENQWQSGANWLTRGPSPAWSDFAGTQSTPLDQIILPRGWEWCDSWKKDVSSVKADRDGWIYGQSFDDIRGNRGASVPNKAWHRVVRRRKWYRPCRRVVVNDGDMTLEEAEKALDAVRLDLMAVKQSLSLVKELAASLGTDEETLALRASIKHAASKANTLRLKCERRLSKEPNFATLKTHVAGSNGAAAWPPPSGNDDKARRDRIQQEWRGSRAQVARLESIVSRVFRTVHSRCGGGSKSGSVDDVGSGGGGSAGGTVGGGGGGGRRRSSGSPVSSGLVGIWDSNGSTALPGRGAGGSSDGAASRTTLPPRVDETGSQLDDDNFVAQGQLQLHADIAAERDEEIRQIAQEVPKMKELFVDLHLMLSSHDESLGAIDDRAGTALASTQRGVEHIEKAKKDQPGCCIT